ncbi:unnamed protein product [Clonostachys rhizophaga]|uniref:Aminoglycoside phosphotransferase domain-containing protein n=1 Tax=Clonostachys rhizophaga TaxID=160324 RepID=A0A9N9VH55_9HYPO|nr:unnamed protein product [Clonostachys rhizophaga]
MALLRSCTNALVPQVFAYGLDDQNSVTSPFILLEFLPGSTAMDEARPYNITDGDPVPNQFRQAFYRSMATTHASSILLSQTKRVQIASARLPQIGSVSRSQDGSFTVGPIPGLGGPFNTAASFIRAWSANVKYPYQRKYLQEHVPDAFLDEILAGAEEFPNRLARLADNGKHFIRDGPFPIRHPDLFHSNVIVTKNFDVLGVIDWEGACTVPWELIDSPCFLTTVPRLLNPPELYDEAGYPLDKDVARKWEDGKAYVTMVQEAERDGNTDSNLSDILGNRDVQDLAGIIHLFAQGKMGFYGRALAYFEIN